MIVKFADFLKIQRCLKSCLAYLSDCFFMDLIAQRKKTPDTRHDVEKHKKRNMIMKYELTSEVAKMWDIQKVNIFAILRQKYINL